jgi:phosphonate transport system substrate-binding protein
MKRLLGLLTFITLLVIACVPTQEPEIAGNVDLNDLQPLATPANRQTSALRVAIAAVISPKGTVESYAPLLRYLEEKLNRPVELIQRRTYMEINDLIAHGQVDMAFVCTSAYIQGHDTFGMELLVAPQVNGKTTYNSLLIVPANSPARSMADLRGKVFAFTDPISLSGRVYPTYLVQQLGSTPEEFFSRTFYTYSHDEAIRAVASGLADGAAVDSLVYAFMLERDPALREKLKVIHTSPDFGIPPVVVNPAIRPQIKHELKSILLEMANDAAAQEVLKSIGVERFVPISDEIYQSARELMRTLLLFNQP